LTAFGSLDLWSVESTTAPKVSSVELAGDATDAHLLGGEMQVVGQTEEFLKR